MSDEEIMEIAKKRVGVLKAFVLHFMIYICSNIFLTLINLFYTPGYIWVLWVVFVWGMGLSIHGSAVFVMLRMGELRVIREFDNIKERKI